MERALGEIFENKKIRMHIFVFYITLATVQICKRRQTDKFSTPVFNLQLWKGTQQIIRTLAFRDRGKFDNSSYFKILGVV